jgi:hypothetical protein
LNSRQLNRATLAALVAELRHDMADVFISYKREDRAAATWLAQQLELNGVSVWWDSKLKGGESFDDAIEHELTVAKCVVVLWSQRSVQSSYVKDEATYALNAKKLLPVSLDASIPSFRFQGLHTIAMEQLRSAGMENPVSILLNSLAPFLGSAPKDAVAQAIVQQSSREKAAKGGFLKAPELLDDSRLSKAVAMATTLHTSLLRLEGAKVKGASLTMTSGFKPTAIADRFTIKIGGSGITFGNKDRANEEAFSFMRENGYRQFEIVDKSGNYLTGNHTYVVQFKR